MADLKEIFDANIANGKNATILALVGQGELDVTVAVREYNRLAREVGLVLGTKERAEKVVAALDAANVDLTQAEVRTEWATRFADEFDVSEATALQHIKDYCSHKGIVLPTIQRTPFSEIVTFVQTDRENGIERQDTVKRLVEHFNLAENSAASAYSNVMRELGLSQGRATAKVELPVLVAEVRAARDLPKADAVKRVCEATGYSEATMKQIFSNIGFAEEWARQGKEEKKKKAA